MCYRITQPLKEVANWIAGRSEISAAQERGCKQD
jgi:hypothetical protein